MVERTGPGRRGAPEQVRGRVWIVQTGVARQDQFGLARAAPDASARSCGGVGLEAGRVLSDRSGSKPRAGKAAAGLVVVETDDQRGIRAAR